MSCAFDLAHYRELLEAVGSGGYRFAFFDHDPEPGDVLLRHDVDFSLDAALELAAAEAELGASTTYLLMTRSSFYNLASGEGERAIAELRRLGHAVGHHALHPHVDLDERFDPVVAWHNPEVAWMSEPIVGAVNVMTPPWFDPARYRSDSNQHWRRGCPHAELAAGEFDWVQILIHPEIWVYPGETMRETMRAMLEAERERRLARLVEDRIDLS